jgi:3-oxoadipate enol-lactonase
MKRIELDNLSIAYDDAGEGMPVLCIHGYPLNRYIWQAQWQGLANSARVIAPDLRDHGDSTVRSEGTAGAPVHQMDLLADDLAHVLDALQITQPVVINGLSMGGYVAFAFIRKYPQRVRGLILTATRARPDSNVEKENRLKAIRLARAQGVEPIVAGMIQRLVSPKTLADKPGMVERLREIMLSSSVAGIIGDLKGMMDRPDARPMLSEIQVPVLIFQGRDDQIIPVDEAQAMNDLIPESRLEIIYDAGHLPNMEQPEIYNQLALDFIEMLQLADAMDVR